MSDKNTKWITDSSGRHREEYRHETQARICREEWQERFDAAHQAANFENQERQAAEMRADRVPGGGVHWPHAHIRPWDFQMSIGPDEGGNYGVRNGFHWRGGLTFSRLKCGCVAIGSWLPSWEIDFQGVGRQRWDQQLVAIIPEMEWASIVCSVSANGEDAERWQHIRDFHGDAKEIPERNSPEMLRRLTKIVKES